MKKIILITLSTLFVVNFSGCELSGHRAKIYGKWITDCQPLDNEYYYKMQFEFNKNKRGSYKVFTYLANDCQDEATVADERNTTYRTGKTLKFEYDNLLVREIDVHSTNDNRALYSIFTLTDDTLTIARRHPDDKRTHLTPADRVMDFDYKDIFHRMPDSE